MQQKDPEPLRQSKGAQNEVACCFPRLVIRRLVRSDRVTRLPTRAKGLRGVASQTWQRIASTPKTLPQPASFAASGVHKCRHERVSLPIRKGPPISPKTLSSDSDVNHSRCPGGQPRWVDPCGTSLRRGPPHRKRLIRPCRTEPRVQRIQTQGR